MTLMNGSFTAKYDYKNISFLLNLKLTDELKIEERLRQRSKC